MTIQSDPPTPVKYRPLYRRGQSVRLLTRNAIGVVVDIRGTNHELAVWPCARVTVGPNELVHLTPMDACARSAEGRCLSSCTNNPCMPRARDGRCHWCDRLLDAVDEQLSVDDDLEGSEVST